MVKIVEPKTNIKVNTKQRVNGKAKGKTFEREVANFLTETYGQKFIRTPNSGAYVGGSNSYRKEQMDDRQIKSFQGDIIAPDDWKYLNLEAKNYADLPFHQIFSGEVLVLDKWISQTKQVANPGDVNLILIKINHKGRYIMFERDYDFDVASGLIYKSWIFCSWDSFWTPDNIVLLKRLCTVIKAPT